LGHEEQFVRQNDPIYLKEVQTFYQEIANSFRTAVEGRRP